MPFRIKAWVKSIFSFHHRGKWPIDVHPIDLSSLKAPSKDQPFQPIDLSSLKASSAHPVFLEDVNGEDDIIIALMGAAGVGKTSFIRAVAGPDSKWMQEHDVHELTFGTHAVNCIKIKIDGTQSHLVLVDTPGLYNPLRSDIDVLSVIADWLKESYVTGKKLNGIVYLHSITDIRFDHESNVPIDRAFTLFQNICGRNISDRVCITTTQWNNVTPELKCQYEELEERLKRNQWGAFLARKSVMSRFDSSTDEIARDTALRTLKYLVENTDMKTRVVMNIQGEMTKWENSHAHRKTAADLVEESGAYFLEFMESLILRPDNDKLHNPPTIMDDIARYQGL
ncbi:hypothetical protein CVT24_008126 [Panaeolus cyanescens]|uniref:G domain-containing protein n=1 Tax=Panaeolus cyanescens TaxID=181874 RepID=A0A409YLJ9_9AGAR|nr:hypothetical protein CVT24_008126 [Panaeolus cyanescens]